MITTSLRSTVKLNQIVNTLYPSKTTSFMYHIDKILLRSEMSLIKGIDRYDVKV